VDWRLGVPPRQRVDRLVLGALVLRYRASGTLERLSPQHHGFWKGESAVRFHATVEPRWESDVHGPHASALDRLIHDLSQGDTHTLCELGCGSGRLIDLIGQRIPTL
jgi:methylase of polypeptide subunit release factors